MKRSPLVRTTSSSKNINSPLSFIITMNNPYWKCLVYIDPLKSVTGELTSIQRIKLFFVMLDQSEIVPFTSSVPGMIMFPRLKGHFSRLEYQSQKYFNRLSSHILPALTLYLPPGIRNAYFYDLIGNVSTSSLRVAPSVPKNKQGTAFSILELRPRYPLLGGWNYSFTLGWDAPLGDSASYNKLTGKYFVEIPIMTPIPGAVINEEELTIILPEGAT